jgi:hypothetical protein
MGLLQGKDAAQLEAGRRDGKADNDEEEDNDRRRVACPHTECRVVTVEREWTDSPYRVPHKWLHVCGSGMAVGIGCPSTTFTSVAAD